MRMADHRVRHALTGRHDGWLNGQSCEADGPAHVVEPISVYQTFRPVRVSAERQIPIKSMPSIRAGADDASLHPSEFDRRAARLFGEGRRDEAVSLFCAVQLRDRFHLAARPDLAPDGDPALFGALSEQVGGPMNEWAFGDPDALVATLDHVLAGDAGTPNAFTPQDRFAGAREETRAGLAALRDHVANRREEIQRQRMANGLPNRAGR